MAQGHHLLSLLFMCARISFIYAILFFPRNVISSSSLPILSFASWYYLVSHLQFFGIFCLAFHFFNDVPYSHSFCCYFSYPCVLACPSPLFVESFSYIFLDTISFSASVLWEDSFLFSDCFFHPNCCTFKFAVHFLRLHQVLSGPLFYFLSNSTFPLPPHLVYSSCCPWSTLF